MRKLLLPVLLVGFAACRATPTPAPTADRLPGGATPEAAVTRFLAAVHAQDLQAMGAVWGTARGPARDEIPRAELEKREIILQCYFDHDSARLLGTGPVQNARRAVRAELTRGGKTRITTFYTVAGPGGRWYVENMDIAAVRDFCGTAPGQP